VSESTIVDFPSFLHEIAAEHQDRVAVDGPTGALTYAELDERTARLARALLASGAGKGTRVAVLAPTGETWLVLCIAAWRIGALVTSISTLSTPAELAYVVRRSDAQLLVGVRRFLSHDYAAELEEALGIEQEGVTVGALYLPSAPYLRSVFWDDVAGLDWAESLADLASRADAPTAPGPEILSAVETEVTPADDAVVIFTSGSTADPKAVVHTQRTLATKPREVQGIHGRFSVSPDDRVLTLLPTFWVGGLTSILGPLSCGATLVFSPGPDPESVIDTVVDFDVTRVIGVRPGDTRFHDELVRRGLPESPGVRGLTAAWAQPDPTKERPHPESIGWATMGMTEAFGWHSAEALDSPALAARPGSVGTAISGFERRVVDPDTGLDVTPGTAGELWLRGGSLMSGYYKVEREQVFSRDGYFPTKDRAIIDLDGFAYFLGRLDDMIKTSGANVSGAEVARALEQLDGVTQAHVVGLNNDGAGQTVVAAVIRHPGADVTESDLRTQLRATLSPFKVPRSIVFIEPDDVPVTVTGKVKASSVRDLIEARLAASQRLGS